MLYMKSLVSQFLSVFVHKELCGNRSVVFSAEAAVAKLNACAAGDFSQSLKAEITERIRADKLFDLIRLAVVCEPK